MNPFRSLWVTLLAAFVLVVVVAIGATAILANRVTTQQFQIYVSQGKQMQAERLAPTLAAYYARSGGWEGVIQWLAGYDAIQSAGGGQQSGGGGQGRGWGRGQAFQTADRLVIVDPDGRVVADSDDELVGRSVSNDELALGASINVDEQRVGTLLIPAGGAPHESQEADFLQQVNRYLLWAGLAAGVVAIGLGLLLARQLTAPLRELTQATHRLAHEERPNSPRVGDVPQVRIRTQDEVGELGLAFNRMALSLAQQETLRRNLMADIAHELRTPLTVIRGDLEALLDGVYEPTPEALGSLQEEALLLSRLVDDLRALAQAEAGQLRLEREPTDLASLLQGVVAGFDLEAEAQGQALSLEISSSLPLVDADPQRVRQVVANLISNALRHAPSPGIEVVVSAVETPGQVQVTVKDDGMGISDQDLPYVFDRFWRGDGARSSGSGLGLAITRELVQAHGGQIWVESTPGEGTAFRFTLPRSRSNSG
jgi:signal transduction histidine kinase